MKIPKAINATVYKLLNEIGYLKHCLLAVHAASSLAYENDKEWKGVTLLPLTSRLNESLVYKYDMLMAVLQLKYPDEARKLVEEKFKDKQRSLYPYWFHGEISNSSGDKCILSTTEDELRSEIQDLLVKDVRTEHTHQVLSEN